MRFENHKDELKDIKEQIQEVDGLITLLHKAGEFGQIQEGLEILEELKKKESMLKWLIMAQWRTNHLL